MKHISPKSQEDHKKEIVALRNWLHGRNFGMTSFCLEYASKFHIHKRKDKITPEFNHMISITSLIRTLSDFLSYREESLALGIFHDLPEDYDISFEKIESDLRAEWKIQKKIYKRENLEPFNIDLFIQALRLITKKYQGAVTPPDKYFKSMENNPIASIVKCADRIHNFATCGAVFSNTKKKQYIRETEEFILPMLKQAQRYFPQQNNAYENLKIILKIQIDTLLSHIN